MRKIIFKSIRIKFQYMRLNLNGPKAVTELNSFKAAEEFIENHRIRK